MIETLFMGGVLLLLFFLFASVKVVYEYQRLVRFRLGRYKDTINPGLRLIIPIIDKVDRIDVRITTEDIPKQEAMTKDNVPVMVDAVVFFRVLHPKKAIIEIDDFREAVSQYARTALRDIIGKNQLDTLLASREKIAEQIKKIVDTATDEWGVDVSAVRIQNIELPGSMKRAMAREAEAERERRATIILSSGEVEAAKNLTKAAATMAKTPIAMQLRTLATISDISGDPAQKIILPIPFDLISGLMKKK
jgi:regulator of protease activity HflC (stomatin/prohibitin superfamily)